MSCLEVTGDRDGSGSICKDGDSVACAGIVLTRQMPGDAGVVFITLSDETGVTNVVVWPGLVEPFRREIMGARLLVVRARVQRSPDNVVHLVAERIFDRTEELDRLSEDDSEAPSFRSQARRATVTPATSPRGPQIAGLPLTGRAVLYAPLTGQKGIIVKRHLIAACAAAAVSCSTAAFADEGMWTFDNFPSAAVKAKYGCEHRPGLARQCARRLGAPVVGLLGLGRHQGRAGPDQSPLRARLRPEPLHREGGLCEGRFLDREARGREALSRHAGGDPRRHLRRHHARPPARLPARPGRTSSRRRDAEIAAVERKAAPGARRTIAAR